jgi:hypothetical protein
MRLKKPSDNVDPYFTDADEEEGPLDGGKRLRYWWKEPDRPVECISGQCRMRPEITSKRNEDGIDR